MSGHEVETLRRELSGDARVRVARRWLSGERGSALEEMDEGDRASVVDRFLARLWSWVDARCARAARATAVTPAPALRSPSAKRYSDAEELEATRVFGPPHPARGERGFQR